MKALNLILLQIILFSSISFSQVSELKKYPLKDFVAPEIKYRMFDLRTSLYSSGLNGPSANSHNVFTFNADVAYLEYKNTQRHQGSSTASLATYFRSQSQKEDSVDGGYNFLVFDLNYHTQNRFYRKREVFFGVHGNISYYITPYSNYSGENDIKRQSHRFAITPYLSVGKGRVQPVESARRAIDILISMEKYNRLAIMPDSSLIDSLARVANRIRYKRFFDRRFKKIYQLEELDNAIQSLGLVNDPDIVYFANLNDIWNFAPHFNRSSGQRIEGGLIPDFWYYSSNYDSDSENGQYKSNDRNIGLYGFFSYNRMRPVNYSWQSDIMIDLTFGYFGDSYNQEHDTDDYSRKSSSWNGLLNASWQFGFFPNTRTYAGITPYLGISYQRVIEDTENIFGINTGLKFNMYYYLSPRLRFIFEANVSYVENFNFNVPTPFWNSVTFNSELWGSGTNPNSENPFPIEARRSDEKQIVYHATITLTYAIF